MEASESVKTVTLGDLTRNQRRHIKQPLSPFEIVILEFQGNRFPVKRSFGQLINPKKAYKRWVDNGKEL